MTKDRKRLVLLDSHAVLHRAYHAIPDLTSSKGKATGALYGLASFILRIAEELKPDYLLAARDLPQATYRHELFDGYKAKRAKTEDALVSQLEDAPHVFEAFGIPVLEAPGFEADDVLGSVVEQVRRRTDLDIIIASGDLDTLQLVDGKRVRVFTLRQGLSDTVLYDEDKVKERYGFAPGFLPDYKGLRGDPSDNIPGIRGIGEKTAAELITRFGSIETMYSVLKKDPGAFERSGIKKRVIALLSEGEEAAAFSKNLGTIRSDAPISFSLPEEGWSLSAHAETIAGLCDELEFRSLKERLRAGIGRASRNTDRPREIPDDRALAEASVGLWILKSDVTNPSLDDVLRFAKTDDFAVAKAAVERALRTTGRLFDVYERIERPLIPVVRRMCEDGIALDTAYLASLAKTHRASLARIESRIFVHAGREFNINSPKQLSEVLYDELKLSLPRQRKTPTGARTTREDELQKMAGLHPIVGDVLAYRELHKLLSTYIEKLPELVGPDGRLHAEFLQAGTTTGRMSSQSPNLQNIPVKGEHGRDIRRAFVAADSFVLVALDYSQIELRIAAGLSGDEKLCEAFRAGRDIHASVAAQVFGVPEEMVDYEMRRRAKVINFGILYGMGANALKDALGAGVSREEASKFLAEYFATFSGLARWIEKTKASAKALGYTETLFGRRRYFSGFDSTLPQVRAQAERMAVNAPVQGTSSDIIKRAMVEADALIEHEALRDDARLVLQIHDELVYEIRESRALSLGETIRGIMQSVTPASELSGVSIVSELALGPNWGELKKQ